ncbi:MAG: hypothetical protein E1N59_800 [Puniceicoccaceae bacterium 5H]|nr:MAG: hypothetical protein E1N59_800 [Puniceicoccaceae bacterium 5H]
MVRYALDDPYELSPQDTPDVVEASTLMRGYGLRRNSLYGSFGSSGFNTSTDLASSQSMGDFFAFDFQVAAGQQVTLDQLSFDYRRDAYGPIRVALGLSRDGFAAEAFYLPPVSLSTPEGSVVFDFGGSVLPTLGAHETATDVAVRLYLWSDPEATRSSGSFTFADLGAGALRLDGNFSHMPEPAYLPLAFGLSGLTLGFLRRLRRRSTT